MREHVLVCVEPAVVLNELVGQAAVVPGQVHAPQMLKGGVRVAAHTRRQRRPACVCDVRTACSNRDSINKTPSLPPFTKAHYKRILTVNV